MAVRRRRHGVQSPSPTFTTTIIDEGSAGFTAVGADWTLYTLAGGYNGDYHYCIVGDGSEVGTWTLAGIPSRTCTVEVTWVAYEGNRNTQSTFKVYDDTALKGTFVIDQRFDPSGDTYGGRPFQSLGSFSVTSGTLKVTLDNSGPDNTKYVIADAIRVS